MSTYIKYIKLGLVVVITAMVYACGSDPISSPTSPPLKPIADEIREKNPDLSYKVGIAEGPATNVFSRGDIDNPYLFSFRVESVDLIEEIEAEIRITEKGNTNKVFYEEKQMAMENSFSVVMDTATRKDRGILEGMYVVNSETLQGKNDFEDRTGGEGDGNSENSFEDFRYFQDGEVYVVGIGPSEENPVDFSQFNRDDELTMRVRILHKGEVIKEGSVDISTADPYDIYTWRDLQNMEDDLDGDYQVKNHIIFPAIGHYGFENFRPVGGSGEGSTGSFTGTFEGNNYKIEGLYMSVKSGYEGGLFGRVNNIGEGASINDVMIQNITIHHRGIVGLSAATGVLAGRFNGGTIRNCHVYAMEDGALVQGNSWVGGLIGYAGLSAPAIIEDSSADTDVWNWAYYGSAGGLVGKFYKGVVRNSHAAGNVRGSRQLGGLIGEVFTSSFEGAKISNVYATGGVQGKHSLGGLIGLMPANVFVSGYATGEVSGDYDVGGLVGLLIRKREASSLVGYFTGKVEGYSNVGGLIGTIKQVDGNSASTTVVRGYSTGNVFGSSYIGGLVGSIQPYKDSWEKSQKKSGKDLHDIQGYARGKVAMTRLNLADTAGLLIGNVFAPSHGKVVGYASASSSGLIGIDNGKAKGIGGKNVATAAIKDNNYRSLFKDLTFGDDTGQWTWVGPGKWPAINVGDKPSVAKQPLGENEVTLFPSPQEEQKDTSLQGIEMLSGNKFKVYETHGVYYEKRRIKSRIPQIDLLPTGLYIKPNATITVTVESDYSLGNKLRLFSGTYSRYREGWDPDGFTLKKGKNVIVNTRNNSRLIYLRLTTKSDKLSKTATVTIEGANKAPFFIHGKTTSAEFQNMLNDYDYESILIASDRIMLVVTKEKALRVKNQDWAETASLLDKAVERSEYIHGLDSTSYYDVPPSTRILAVERDEDGGPWSATIYRIMAPRSGIMGWIDNTKIVQDWALWHEIGHMYEPAQILMGEVNVNIYSLAVEREFSKITGNKSRLARLNKDGKNVWMDIMNYLAKPTGEKDFDKINVFWKLGMLQQLWLGYGKTDKERDQFYIKLNKKIREESKYMPKMGTKRLEYLILKASEVYDRNLNDFFKAWGLKLPQEAFDAVDAFSSTKPTVDPSTLSEL